MSDNHDNINFQLLARDLKIARIEADLEMARDDKVSMVLLAIMFGCVGLAVGVSL